MYNCAISQADIEMHDIEMHIEMVSCISLIRKSGIELRETLDPDVFQTLKTT